MHKLYYFLMLSSIFMSSASYSTNLEDQKRVIWRNWAQNQQCTPELFFWPQTRAELQAFIKKAGARNKKVHVAGGGHSWSNIVCTPEYLISIDKLNRILHIDRQAMLVKVEAGITFDKLNRELTKAGLALSNQSAIMVQTVAGATATATHGTGRHTGTLASFIKELELVKADGSIVTLSSEKQPELFAAAKVGIGSLGVLYTVTLQCERLFKVVSSYATTTLSHVLKNYRQLHKDNDYFMFRWNPYDDTVSLDMVNKVSSSSEQQREQPAVGDYLYEALSSPTTGGKRMEEEIAVAAEQLPTILRKLKPLLISYKRKNLPILGGVLCRFVAAEHDVYLSPAVGRNTVYISISTSTDHWQEYKEFYKKFEELLLQYNGRPHWGKINFLDYSKAFKLYGNNFTQFLQAKKALDPKNMFSNSFTERVLKS